jgi:hypothetical protein
MAVFAATPVVSGIAPTVISLATVTASSEQAPGNNVIVYLSTDQALMINFGPAGNVTNPTAGVGFRIPANTIFTFDTGVINPSFKVFNTAGSTANITWAAFSKF